MVLYMSFFVTRVPDRACTSRAQRQVAFVERRYAINWMLRQRDRRLTLGQLVATTVSQRRTSTGQPAAMLVTCRARLAIRRQRRWR